jgi:pSer/pThr/pTyr-binding forkhead associated (FHA) protein
MSEEVIALLRWQDPTSQALQEFMLVEGATATIGRSSGNDIVIADQHVSRNHAVIRYRDGLFLISDLNSSNGTFVNDTRITEPFPLFAGDIIRLFVPTIEFLAADADRAPQAAQAGAAPRPAPGGGQATLLIANGPQEGQVIPLLLDSVTVGRATSSATWEVLLQDASVSRPHARLTREQGRWSVVDLGSSNGTRVNAVPVKGTPHALNNGDTLELGSAMLVFRLE